LKGCQRNIEVWQRILMVRSSVVSPTEDMQMWIKFVGLCRKGGRLAVAERTLAELCGVESLDEGVSISTWCIYAYMLVCILTR
jgi:FKBP12-rapamycin complex-associated protein